MGTNFRNKPASQHSFAMIPRADIPRSTYALNQNRKQTFNAGDLIPFYCEEMVPGDHFQGRSTIFARLATPITPVLDNAELETFFFVVPNRIIWDHWEEFMAGGNYLIPQVVIGLAELTTGSIWDQFGLPVAGQYTQPELSVNALPFRAYNKIYNDWFRDQNLTTALTELNGDGPDTDSAYAIQKRAKKHDYFTSALPWPQKGATAVTLPLGSVAPVVTTGVPPTFEASGGVTWPGPAVRSGIATDATNIPKWQLGAASGAGNVSFSTTTGLQTDLSAATAATINSIRTAFQVQRYLERMARGGSRYTEIIQAQFGVHPQDFRLSRPEYIGGGRIRINTHPIPQTSATDAAVTPQGNLAAFTTAQGGGHNFNFAALEHCYIIGIAQVRCDLTYQQGLRRHWSRSTNLDFYTPVFAHLGEQAVLSKEIYCDGTADDNDIFGYQERWAEYRYTPNEITGLFKSRATGTIDVWHYSEEFATRPELNNTFITDPSEDTLMRSLAVGEEAAGQQILFDVLHEVRATRPMPTYSVPGLIDHL